MIRYAVKSALRAAVAAIGPHRWRRGPCLLVLTYHRVLPKEHPARATEQPGMLVSPELLAMHLEVLQRYFTPIHLDDWLRAAKGGEPPPGRSLAITFDDGWRDNYDYAFPILQKAAVPATIFLVTDMVGTNYRFWPNRLALSLKAWRPQFSQRLDENTKNRMVALGIPLDLAGDTATPELIDTVISRCKLADDASMRTLLDAIERTLPATEASDAPVSTEPSEQRDLLDWHEIREMSDTDFVRFGSHTRRHTRLREGLAPYLLEDEVVGSKRSLEHRLGRTVSLFCYPNGDCSPHAYAAVSAAYDGAVSTHRGWNVAEFDPYAVRRIGMHGDVSANSIALLARSSGWAGV